MCGTLHVVVPSTIGQIKQPEDEPSHAVASFFRAAAANTNRIQGTGLGLSIAQAIADGHAGTIALNRSDGDGTTFRLTLPLAAGQREEL
jgi:signal transduction histidine kinase